jgi:arsenate reductase (glutaredoxin)
MLRGKREHERGGNVKITVYQKPTCSTCRRVFSILQESDIAFDSVNYYINPIPKAKLKELLQKMNVKPREILRTNE